VAEVVLAYCSSHAPMMSSAREAAPKEQRDNFLGALDSLRRQARDLDVQACVFLSNEHFTNFFLENFPQICVGVGERNWGPTEEWLPIDKVWIPGHEGLANHIMRHTLDNGFDPAFSHQLELDHGIMTVYYELDAEMQLPLVPIVMNCAVPPLMPVWRWYEFGKQLGAAIRSFDGLERVAVVGCGGLSHWIGNPRVGDINEEFDRWFCERLERGEIDRQRQPRDADVGGGRGGDGRRPGEGARLRAHRGVDHGDGGGPVGHRPREHRVRSRRVAGRARPLGARRPSVEEHR
jgi:hypothetical protein